MEEEMKTADETNVVVKDALALPQHRINVMRRQVVALNPNLHPSAQQDPVVCASFQAEIDSDNALANINKFNYIEGQLEPNVLVTLAHSNENYPVLHYVLGLDALGKAPENYEDTFVCMLLEKFHGEVRKNVERKHYQDESTLEQISLSTLRDRLRDAGINGRHPAKKNNLTEVRKAERLLFAHGFSPHWFHRLPGGRHEPSNLGRSRHSTRKTINDWGCVTYYVPDVIHRIYGWLNTHSYMDISTDE
ncbi:hypothetical protein DAPPUDRAFT_108283 [Daphnia pulex]|uniref:Uncharacterized protein n=1 Tax=Daphnia pulex TaxID=6669 RepID=E9GZP4_DAPPU|nr:hypothetical protein DAPPUDRAFT_108283 [Daphnia pulex]|eukprot:EFX75068.1 hypothetical protein DAPPUDRAFT_108283 [Daphnia pulex]